MKKLVTVTLILVLMTATGCAGFLPTVSTGGSIKGSDGNNYTVYNGLMSEQAVNDLVRNTAQADRLMRLGEAQADFVKSQADLNRVMGRVIEKNPELIWYGYGLGWYGLGMHWSEFQQNIYYPEAILDWNASRQDLRRKAK